MTSRNKLTELALDAIGNPVRREILFMLSKGPQQVSHIAGQFDISRPAISKHISLLLRAGLVRSSIFGNRNAYELDEAGFKRVEKWTGSLRAQTALNRVQVSRQVETEDPFAGLLD